ncbi:glycosyltransferase [Clostridium sp. 19966]|uniref:glycosyltransferase n=1 Tax=Clostridium sp. 19966 TaxID=2768166 RepID=UPI0028E04C39|nr:glycosyltransferase [Clostridium sp. 19966]MDT8715725.1 glycosyltransferase [Clostridium sp. 19966]
MRILISTDTFYPMINGVVISTNNLYKYLKQKGHEVKIITLSSTGEERIEGDIYYLKSFKLNIYPGLRCKSPFNNKLIREIIEWQPEIIHSQTEFSTMFISRKISKKLNIPQVHTYHTMYEDYLKYIFKGKLISKNMSRRIMRIILNSLNAIVVPTDKVKRALIDYGVNKEFYVIPTGIDISKFKNKISLQEKKELLQKYNLLDKKVFAYVGRIGEEKNIEEIIEHFSIMSKEHKDIVLMVVGGGPYLAKLIKLVNEKRIEDRVRFTGMVDSKEVYKYYQLADIFVTASTSETQGLTYIEALASGVPVVCKYDACIENLIINNKNGFAFKSEREFIEAAASIIYDEKIKESMKLNCFNTADEYSIESFGEKLINTYSVILEQVKESKQNDINMSYTVNGNNTDLRI